MKGEMMEEIQITELVEGGSVFESHGLTRVKVTKEGEPKTLIFKIKSSGVADLVDTFSKDAPTPPVKNELILPDSDLGRLMKLSKKEWCRIPDFTDPDYIKNKEKFDQDLGMAILLQGLDLEFKREDGSDVTDSDEKVEILKQQGMTGEQFLQVIRDIQDLTRWEEARQDDFFEQS
jgi:hypothetical protein